MASMIQPDHIRGDQGRDIFRPGRRSMEEVRLSAFAVQHDGDRARSLSLLIEQEIIPRLVVAHAPEQPPEQLTSVAASSPADVAITVVDIEQLATLALQVEADALLDHVEAVIARGVAIDALLVDLLAPAARALGQWWEDDRCDFIDVTMGLWRLQEAVNELAARIPPHRPLTMGGRRALFASMPGDQHSFGTVVIDELFRREGWLTDRMSEAENSDLLRRVAEDHFDIVGLTVGCEGHIAALPSLIVALRNVSRNPHICVMVGGWIFSADPELATRVGADGTARDAKLALKVASTLVRLREREALVAC